MGEKYDTGLHCMTWSRESEELARVQHPPPAGCGKRGAGKSAAPTARGMWKTRGWQERSTHRQRDVESEGLARAQHPPPAGRGKRGAGKSSAPIAIESKELKVTCVQIPSEFFNLVKEPEVKFICVACHWKDDVLAGNVTPYQSFYRDAKAVLSSFPVIKGNFELSLRLCIYSKKTVIIHLQMHTIPPGGPVNILEEFLRPYHLHSGELQVFDVEFNLSTAAKRNAYARAASTISSQIHGSVDNTLITISNHTDEDSGDLFLGKLRNKDVAGAVDETLLAPLFIF
ncbi:hypothetical protein HYDPIDRAFT_30335 [Hydnomerulius pinastri MD-312]|uniref:Uncharacterized protein n=1 Tax=Hydnomerulius pinastri MD-312 TaxID=994086 RepID=A0A0C9VX12_9AGAM|nr:hypothetical protein HYDPIDRAFT_30335 [Hydnomerulius pinastri MD-312]